MTKDNKKAPEKPRRKPGPEAETIVIEGATWEMALGTALQKTRPPEGWPKEPAPRKKPKPKKKAGR